MRAFGAVRSPRARLAGITCGFLSACALEHGLPSAQDGCTGVAPRCATRTGPCDPLQLVAAQCLSSAWKCPSGSAEFVAPWTDDVCLPLRDQFLPAADGVHEAPVPVPIEGRCMWVFPVDGAAPTLSAVATATRCADLHELVPLSAHAEGSDYIALSAAFLDAQAVTRVLVRGWSFDAHAGFGVRSDGVGLGRVSAYGISVATPWLFGADLDLGDAALVHEGYLYAYGCPGAPHALEEDCIVARAPLARIAMPEAWSVYGEGGWGAGKARRVFGSGPHRGPVVRDPRGRGFLHVYAIGFGSTLELTRAEHPEGPWEKAKTLARCTLPEDDPGAYCAGPVVHLELFDPTRPDELIVSYAIGSTSAEADRSRMRSAYWPRVERLRREAE